MLTWHGKNSLFKTQIQRLHSLVIGKKYACVYIYEMQQENIFIGCNTMKNKFKFINEIETNKQKPQ